MLRLVIFLLIPFFLCASEVETICQIDTENAPEVLPPIPAQLTVGLLMVQFADYSTNVNARGSAG